MDAVAVSRCIVNAGKGVTIIPDNAETTGTVRLLRPAIRNNMPSMVEDIVRGVTAAFVNAHTREWDRRTSHILLKRCRERSHFLEQGRRTGNLFFYTAPNVLSMNPR
ncbi:MAG: hypothetical protein JSV16_16970 [Candidatus Hydrogenedentota bacterium]|nr:MAG: hypothetical protein JSV16_16970 [Candidatus Hydrogenedentota bacterium]